MTWAKATLYLLLAVLLLVAAGLYALYQISAIGFGVALGAVATMILGTFFMLAVAVAVRIVNGGGRRTTMRESPAPTVEGPPPPMYFDPTAGNTLPMAAPASLTRHDA